MLEHGSHGGPKSGVLEHRLLAAHRSQAAGAPSARRPMIPPGVLELCSPPSAVRRAGAPYARRPMTNTRRPATTRQKAVQPACFLKRPRVFARSAGFQHRLHPQAPATLREPHGLSTQPASPSARESSRAPPAVNTACILKRSRPFASHTGCQHRLHPPGGSSLLAAHQSLAAGAPSARPPTANPAARACSPPIQVSRLEHHLLAAQRLTRRLELDRRPYKS